MSSRVRLTASEGRLDTSVDPDLLVKLMSAGRKDSVIFGGEFLSVFDEGACMGENVVVSIVLLVCEEVTRRGWRGAILMVWVTGKFSGVELRRERRVWDDEVEVLVEC